MSSVSVSRTLVKSPPEVWAELERDGRLAELLALDGLEVTVAQELAVLEWQAEQASGRIEIKASGWGTKVSLTADVEAEQVAEVEPVAEVEHAETVERPKVEQPEPEPEPEPVVVSDPEPAPVAAEAEPVPLGFWARLKLRLTGAQQPAVTQTSEPAVAEPPPVEAPPVEPVEPAEEDAPPNEVAATSEAGEPDVTEPEQSEPGEPADFEARLLAVLDHLGTAHKRPFSSM
jgi:hypothetical protein